MPHDRLDIVIVGIGGVGSTLAPLISRHCEHLPSQVPVRITIVDGDAYEEKNATRQAFARCGNKATATVEMLCVQFPRITFQAVEEYLTPENVSFLIGEGAIVFCCVDNNPSRKVMDDFIGTLTDAVLISGGNDLTDGNVQMYIRRDGRDVTRSLSSVHPETARPEGKAPYEMSCEELAMASSPQLFLANAFVAILMFLCLYHLVEMEGALDNPRLGELYFDLQTGRVEPVDRTNKLKEDS